MKEQVAQRLRQLQQEYESGKKMLASLNAQAQELNTNLLRLSGAVQVLQEEIAKFDNNAKPGNEFENSI